MSDLSRNIANLSPEQRALLEKRLARLRSRPEGKGAPAGIPRRAGAGPAPPSFAQERLWFLERLAPGSAAYHIPAALRLSGKLDVAALAGALAEILRRHTVLRTAFAAAPDREEDGPVQLVVPLSAPALPVVDLGGLPAGARDAELARWTAAEARRPFDLTHGPLLRALLIRLAPAEWRLCTVMHHIASDGWSVGVLVRETAALYDALAGGRAAGLPELAIQYADFAAWQREQLSGEALASRLAECVRRLAGTPEVLELPYDRPPRGERGGRGAQRSLALAPELAARLRGLAQAHGTTLFGVLLSAFEVLLARLSGQDEFLVGLPFAGRGRPELEPLIGFFAETLLVRARLREQTTLAELLGQTRQAMADALLQQDLPFDRLVAELAPRRAAGRMPLVQAVFALQTDPLTPFEVRGLRMEPVEVFSGAAKFDLLLTMTAPAGERAPFLARIEYDAGLFDPATAERLLRCLRVLLVGLAGAPKSRPLDLPLLELDELYQVLVAWNDTVCAYPREATLGALFAAQAACRPEALALVSTAERLTYGELDRRANRLARRLRRRGVGPERPVALCLERSVEALVAILAVVKAGGVYVPLDPALPAERLAWLLDDAGAAVAVTRTPLLRGWEEAVPVVLCLDGMDEAAAIATESGLGLDDRAVADNLAYVMYTSGSTGTPKGVGVVHRAVVRLVQGSDLPRLAEDDVVLHLAPLSFDASTLEIWGALLNGGRLVVAPPGVPTPAELGRELERHGVTMLWLTAGLFHLMVEEAPGVLARVRQLLAGGDVLSAEHVGRLCGRRAETATG